MKLHELIERRVPHIVAIYAAAVLGMLEFLDWAQGRFGISPFIAEGLFIVAATLLPTVFVLAYGHGKPGKDEFTRREVGFGLANLVVVIAALGLWHQTRSSSPEPTSVAENPTPPAINAPTALQPSFEIDHYVLDNGLEVVLAPDDQAAGVTVSVAYKVGRAQEPAGLEGLSHFAEHVLFQGSEQVARGEYGSLIQSVGGQYNGSVRNEALVTYATVPPEQLELALFLEADRLRAPRFDPAVVDRERRVVLEEMTRTRRSPYFEAVVVLLRELFKGQPEQSLLHGSLASIKAIDAAALAEFAEHYLHAGNAVLTVAGRFERSGAQQKIADYFGSIQTPVPIVLEPRTEFPITSEPVELTINAPTAPAGAILLGWRIPSPASPEGPALAAALKILASGESSILHRELVTNREVALSVQGAVMGDGSVSGAMIYIVLREGKDAKEVVGTLKTLISEFVAGDTTSEQLRHAVTLDELALAADRDSSTRMAAMLSLDTAVYGRPDARLRAFDRLQELDKETMDGIVSRWFVPENQVVVIAVPGGEREPPWTLPELLPPLPPEEPVGKAPVAESRIAAPRLEPTVSTLENGLTLITIARQHRTLVNFGVYFANSGPLLEEDDQLGIASLAAQSLMAGADGRGSSLLNLKGANATGVISPDQSAIGIRGTGLARLQADWIPTVGEIVAVDNRPTDDMARRIDQFATSARFQQRDLASRVQTLVLASLYPNHSAGRQPDAQSYSSMDTRDVRRWIADHVGASTAVAIFEGLVDHAYLEAELAKWQFGNPSVERVDWPDLSPMQSAELTQLTGAPGGMVAVGARTISRSHPRYPVLNILNQIMGGSSGRLAKRIRTDEGLAYEVSSRLTPRPYESPYMITIPTAPASIPRVMEALMDELNRIRTEPVPADELQAARQAAAGRFVLSSDDHLSDYLLTQYLYGFSDRYLMTYADKLQSVSAAELQDLAKDIFDPASMKIVVATPGDDPLDTQMMPESTVVNREPFDQSD